MVEFSITIRFIRIFLPTTRIHRGCAVRTVPYYLAVFLMLNCIRLLDLGTAGEGPTFPLGDLNGSTCFPILCGWPCRVPICRFGRRSQAEKFRWSVRGGTVRCTRHAESYRLIRREGLRVDGSKVNDRWRRRVLCLCVTLHPNLDETSASCT